MYGLCRKSSCVYASDDTGDIIQTMVLIEVLGVRICEILSKYGHVIKLPKGISGFSDKAVENIGAEISFNMSKIPSKKPLSGK